MKTFAWSAALLGAALLAACGGSDDPPAVARAQDDSASVTWNRASTLSVLANDTVQNGSASIALTAAPSHGEASVDGTVIRYRPAAGYFGSDTLRYTLTVGDQTAQAAVQITVAAELTLAGTVRDAALPAATVVATVGSTVLPAVTADASGNYRLPLQLTDPAAFISLKATGAGSQSSVVLTSLAGDAQSVAAVAATAASGVVDGAALPAVNVTHISTAQAVLAQQALGKAASSNAELASTLGKVSVAQTLEMATAIKLVADLGAALPAGSADTLALVSNAEALRGFVVAQFALDAGLSFNAAQQAVLADPLLAVVLPTPALGSTPTVLTLVRGDGAAMSAATRVTLLAGNIARVESAQVNSATWARDGSDIKVSFDSANTSTSFSADLDPVTRQQNQIEVRETGLVIRRLGAATASVKRLGTSTYVDGSRAGQVLSGDGGWGASTLLTAAGAPFVEADLAPGTRWAGILASDYDLYQGAPYQDVLSVIDASTVVFEHTQQRGSVRLVAGKLELSFADKVYLVSRLFTGPLGEERWLVEKRVNGAAAWVYEAAAIKVQAGVAFTAAGLAKRWKSYINGGRVADEFFFELSADGSGRQVSLPVGGSAQTSSEGKWSIDSDGSMTLTRTTCATNGSCTETPRRRWKLLATEGNRIYVMEQLLLGGSLPRVNIYAATP